MDSVRGDLPVMPSNASTESPHHEERRSGWWTQTSRGHSTILTTHIYSTPSERFPVGN